MKEMHERAVKAAARYAEIKGYEVVDRDWASEALAGRIDLVAKDDGAYVFIEVTAVDRSEGGFASSSRCWPRPGSRTTRRTPRRRSGSTPST